MRGVDSQNQCAYFMRMTRSVGTKKPLNVTVDERLLRLARESNINVSLVLDKALRQEIGRRWREDNADAFEENRKRVEAEGLWNDKLRTW
jgi:post-segregation antitoxin (ccd killing protein)